MLTSAGNKPPVRLANAAEERQRTPASRSPQTPCRRAMPFPSAVTTAASSLARRSAFTRLQRSMYGESAQIRSDAYTDGRCRPSRLIAHSGRMVLLARLHAAREPRLRPDVRRVRQDRALPREVRAGPDSIRPSNQPRISPRASRPAGRAGIWVHRRSALTGPARQRARPPRPSRPPEATADPSAAPDATASPPRST